MTLVQIRPGVILRDIAARSFIRITREAGRDLSVNRTTESEAQQMRAYKAYLAHLAGGPWAPFALHPTKSRHVYRETDPTSGTAWDTDERGEWLDENGWIADVKDEPWHREYRHWLDRHINDPDPITRRRQTMLHAAYRNDDGSIAVQPTADVPPRFVQDINEWQGILAANPGIYAAQVSNDWLRKKMNP